MDSEIRIQILDDVVWKTINLSLIPTPWKMVKEGIICYLILIRATPIYYIYYAETQAQIHGVTWGLLGF